MNRNLRHQSAVLAVALVLTACGGGSGSSGGSGGAPAGQGAVPAPPPPPSPPPAATRPPAPFGITASQSFATVGWAVRQGSSEYVSAASLLSLGWSRDVGTYVARLPDLPEASLEYTFPGNNPYAFSLVGPNGSRLPATMTIATASATAPYGLYSGFGAWQVDPGAAPAPQYREGQFAFGLATAPGDVPLNGTARYQVTGWWPYDARLPDIQLEFDFAAATVGGRVDLVTDGWFPSGTFQYPIQPLDFTRGSTTFSAGFDVPGMAEDGLVEGRFTGPQANELILRFRIPVRWSNGETFTFYGTGIGRRN